MHAEQERIVDEIATRHRMLTTEELQAEYTVTGFSAPFVGVVRKADGQRGSMMFVATHPRYYYDFQPDN